MPRSVALEGHYHGRNLHVQNSFNAAQGRFCTIEIVVNGEVTNDNFDVSVYEIDFKARNLHPGDAVTVRIYHMDECGIRVLNPEVLAP